MPAKPRLAFVTIGESPRDDLVPELLSGIGFAVEAHEFGALDGLSDAEVAAMAPRAGETAFATRRRNGSEVAVAKERVEERLEAILKDIDGKGFDAVVVLCTGTHLAPLSNTLMIEAQRVVDAMVEAIGASARNLGVLLPLERQVTEFPARHVFSVTPRLAAASPYAGDDMTSKARALAGCDLVVMHCMGYTEAMRKQVLEAVDAPVLLSRRIVSDAIRQIL